MNPSKSARKTVPPPSNSPTSQSHQETIPPAREDSLPNPHGTVANFSQAFGRYEMLECLGQGAMGSVYKARDTQLDRIVALKIPKFSADAEPGLLERFYREARSAATLNHPHICPVYDVGEENGTHYISMSYIEGRPLSAFIKPEKPLPGRKAAGVVRKLAIALEEAHRNGIVHRDLKPDNVMIDHRGQPVIMDFGLALQSSTNPADTDIRMTQSGQMMGTPAYMSPEQVDGNIEQIGPASDVYSLGVIFYELITGMLPYQGSVASVLAQIIQGQPVPPSQRQKSVDANLEAICLKMMAAQQADRYSSMAEAAKAVSQWIKGESPEAANTAKPQAADEDLEALFSVVETDSQTSPARKTQQPRSRQTAKPARSTGPSSPRKSQPKPLVKQPWFLGAGIGLAVLLLLWGVIFFVRVGDQTVKIEIDDPKAQIFINGDQVKIQSSQGTVELKPGKHNLEVRHGNVIVQTKKFEVVKGDNPVLKIHVVQPSEENPLIAKNDPPSEIPLSPEKPKPAPEPKVVVNVPVQPKPVQPKPVHPKPIDPKPPAVVVTKPDETPKNPALPSGDLDRQFIESLSLEKGAWSFSAESVDQKQRVFQISRPGQIPDDDFKITTVLYHGHTKLPQNTLKQISQLRSLTRFSVHFSAIDDEGVRIISQCKSLTMLQLSSSFVTDQGIRHLTTLPALISLELSRSQVTDEGIAFLGKFTMLENLKLSEVKITDKSATTIGQFTKLRFLVLDKTAITDQSAEMLSRLTELKSLRLSNTAVSDKTLAKIAGLLQLMSLGLESTQISDAGLKSLANHPAIVSLDLDKTKISDVGLSYLTALPRLEGLFLESCPITDEGVVNSLTKCSHLHSLYISDTPITDKSLGALADGRSLSSLQLAHTRVTQAGLEAFQKKQLRCRVYPKTIMPPK